MMHVQIALETPYQAFTNLDVVKGKILLRLPSTVPLTSIVVKLEGESTTQMIPKARDDYDDKPRPVLEIHKVGCTRCFPLSMQSYNERTSRWVRG